MPTAVVLRAADGETLTVPVFDERPRDDRESERLPDELDDDDVEAMEDELLFERFGGPAAGDDGPDDESKHRDGPMNDDDEVPESEGSPPAPGDTDVAGEDGTSNDGGGAEGLDDDDAASGKDSYAVPTFLVARRHLGIVDNWVSQTRASEG